MYKKVQRCEKFVGLDSKKKEDWERERWDEKKDCELKIWEWDR